MKRPLIVVLTLVFLLGIMILGYAKRTKMSSEVAVVKSSQQTVQFPNASNIQHVYVVWGLAARSFSPRNQAETLSEIERWLHTAQPVSVQLPPPPNPPVVINANTNPAGLVLELFSKEHISISPTFYMSGQSNDLSKLYHFVDGVITYQVGNRVSYFKDPDLYNWLKSNAWQKQFNVK